MNEDELKAGEAETPKPDYNKDPNVKARARAGRRSANRNSGKDIEDGVAEIKPTDEGGIVAEAEKEEAAVATPEEEAPAETPEEEAAEPAAEEKVETPAAEAEETPAEETPAEETTEEEPVAPAGEYQAPEGATHDELIDQYHEALAIGDMETAKALYKQLQEHRFQENVHRTKTEAQAAQEAKAYVAAATELAAKHPELAEDGIEANKVLALSDVYRNEGMSAADALRKAVADLYPEAPAVEAAPAEPAPAPEEPVPAEEEAPALPDMSEREEAKRNIPAMPSASARNEPAPPPKQPTRSDAVEQMKRARGQA